MKTSSSLKAVDIFLNSGVNPELPALNNFLNMDRFTDVVGGQKYENNFLVDHLESIGHDFSKTKEATSVLSKAKKNNK